MLPSSRVLYKFVAARRKSTTMISKACIITSATYLHSRALRLNIININEMSVYMLIMLHSNEKKLHTKCG